MHDGLLHRAIRRLDVWSRRRFSSSLPGGLSVAGKLITDLVPLGNELTPGVTKAGRLSLRGVCEGRAVKVYSSFSPSQTALRLAIQGIQLDGCEFPPIIAADDELVVEAWISGRPVAALRDEQRIEAAQRVAAFLATLRAAPDSSTLVDEHRGCFDYLDDYLLRRLGAWKRLAIIDQFLRLWSSEYTRLEKQIPECLSHPDLSANNIISESGTGRLFVIDNELLGIGRGWILDARNSFLDDGSVSTSCNSEALNHFVARTWALRRLGSALDEGRMADIAAIVAPYVTSAVHFQ